MIDLVCSVCGSPDWSDVQHSVDTRWPVARCKGKHRDRGQLWFPLISAGAFQKRTRLRREDEPIDLFGGLSLVEQAQLKAPIHSRPIGRRFG